MSSELPSPRLRRAVLRTLHGLLLAVSAVFVLLHFLHLNADFPNYSAWMDWSKYTDEGWYGDAAIRHFQRGHWYVPGDFNPAAALPVWPLLESVVFHFTGVSVVAARGLTVTVFALILATSWLLIRRSSHLDDQSGVGSSSSAPTLAPAIAILLLSVSPFCYVFTRLAILEPFLVFLTLLALLVASYLSPSQQGRRTVMQQIVLPALLGLLIPMMVLTKTTAVFLLPALGWLLWTRAGYRFRPFMRLCLVPAIIAATAWLGYYLVVVRPQYLLDYRYLFSANAYTGITASTAFTVILNTISDGIWMGRLLLPLALLAVLLAALRPRLLRTNPLILALIVWATGYAAFLAYHNNLQPRYYFVIAVPLTLLIPIVFESLWRAPVSNSAAHMNQAQTHPMAAGALVLAVLAIVVLDARQTLRFVRNPQYSFVAAAEQIKQIIAADHTLNPTHNPLLLSISGSDLSLMTGLPSICDDFGTMELPVRIKTYQPGWFVAWNQVDDDKMDALAPFYELQRVASFPVMDDPERNLLILYRLNPAGSSAPHKSRRRRPIPRLLQTKIGQQPSETQLEH